MMSVYSLPQPQADPVIAYNQCCQREEHDVERKEGWEEAVDSNVKGVGIFNTVVCNHRES